MYGSGLRVSEACQLRVKDLDFSRHVITTLSDEASQERSTCNFPPLAQWSSSKF
ncbi:tyrosine-type recombinase/integrase [Vreelandella sp. H-I2]